MRPRLPVLLGATLVASGLAVGFLGATANAADVPTTRVYLHGTASTYQGDAQADPAAAEEGRAPKGSFGNATPPTGATSKTASTSDLTGSPGVVNAPTWSLPVAGTLKSACLDIFVAATNPGATFPIYPAFGKGDPVDGAWTYPAPVTVTTTAGGPTRVTALVTLEAPFELVAESTVFFYVSSVDPDPAQRPYTISYDSLTHFSNVVLNPSSCTPAPTPPRPTPSASASPTASAPGSATPTATSSSAPSRCPTPAPTPTASTTSSATGAPSPTATASATATATATATAAPSPTATATATAVATPSATSSPTAAPTANPTPPPTDGCNTPTRITLNVDVPRITAGNRPTLFGVVTDDLNKPVAGGRVDIFGKGYGQTSYTLVGTAVTDPQGRYALRVAPTRQTAYGAHTGSIRSRVIVVRVHTRVDIARPAPGTVSNPVTFSGQLTPRFANVAVGLGYLAGGRFVVLAQTRTTATGGYTLTRALPRGTFTFVVFTSAHEGSDRGSRSVRLTVR